MKTKEKWIPLTLILYITNISQNDCLQLPPPPPRPERGRGHHNGQPQNGPQYGQPQYGQPQNGQPPPYGFNQNVVHRKYYHKIIERQQLYFVN